MQTAELINEIQRVSLSKKFYVVEETLKSIKNDEVKLQMKSAAEALYNDYGTDKELTSFTSLVLENFYETK